MGSEARGECGTAGVPAVAGPRAVLWPEGRRWRGTPARGGSRAVAARACGLGCAVPTSPVGTLLLLSWSWYTDPEVSQNEHLWGEHKLYGCQIPNTKAPNSPKTCCFLCNINVWHWLVLFLNHFFKFLPRIHPLFPHVEVFVPQASLFSPNNLLHLCFEFSLSYVTVPRLALSPPPLSRISSFAFSLLNWLSSSRIFLELFSFPQRLTTLFLCWNCTCVYVRACVCVWHLVSQKSIKDCWPVAWLHLPFFESKMASWGDSRIKCGQALTAESFFFFWPCVCVQLSFVFGAQLHARSDVNRNDVVRSGGDWVYCREAPKGLFVKPSRLNYPEINPSDMSQTYSTV